LALKEGRVLFVLMLDYLTRMTRSVSFSQMALTFPKIV
jgi:hypothetical protein